MRESDGQTSSHCKGRVNVRLADYSEAYAPLGTHFHVEVEVTARRGHDREVVNSIGGLERDSLKKIVKEELLEILRVKAS